MQPFEVSFYILAFLIAMLFVIVLCLLIYYFRLKEKYLDLKNVSLAKATPDEISIEKSKKIIEEAVARSSEILNETVAFTSSVKERASSDMGKVSQAYEMSLAETLDSFKSGIEGKTTSMISEVGSEVDTKVAQLFEKLQKDLWDGNEKRKREFEEQLLQIKQEKLKKIDQEIVSMVESIVEQVLGKVISVEQHEELVMEALTKAKKEHVI